MQALLDWLTTLPPGTLYAVLFGAAAIENIFPPFPSDVVVAFGSFIIAQGGRGTLVGVFAATWIGNVGSAMLLYALGRRYGAERTERRLAGRHAEQRDARIRALMRRWGMAGVFLSRFIPGVRAIVPAVAGALRLPVVWTTVMIGVASALWYGFITTVAFRAGSNWEALRDAIARFGMTAAIGAAVLLALGIGTWMLVRRRSRAT